MNGLRQFFADSFIRFGAEFDLEFRGNGSVFGAAFAVVDSRGKGSRPSGIYSINTNRKITMTMDQESLCDAAAVRHRGAINYGRFLLATAGHAATIAGEKISAGRW
jgi:hypothetical protein